MTPFPEPLNQINPEPLVVYLTQQNPQYVANVLDKIMHAMIMSLHHNSDINGVDFSHHYDVLYSLRNSICECKH